MLAENHTTVGTELFAYVVASGDMRFIEISQRALFLRHHPELGRIIRGEVPECGPACYANLSQVLLEYVMGCSDCHESDRAAVEAERFGRQVAHALLEHLPGDFADRPGHEQLVTTATIILNSMPVPFTFNRAAGSLRFAFPFCPLQITAEKGGLNLWKPLARRAFIVLLATLLAETAPDWTLTAPDLGATSEPIHEVQFNHS